MSNIVPVKEYQIAKMEENIQELFEMNFGDEGLLMTDLPKAKMPSTGGGAFTLPGPDGEDDMVKAIEGVIVHAQPRRVFFEKSFDEDPNGKPKCYSLDGKVGGPNGEFAGRSCKNCPFAKFGPNNERPQCTQRLELYILQKDALLPLVLNLPPTSLQNWRKYKTFLFGRGFGAYQYVITQIGLKTEETQGGRRATKAVFKPVHSLGKVEREKIAEYIAGIKPFIERTSAEDQQAQFGDEPADLNAEPVDINPDDIPFEPAAGDDLPY
jgi:hypothetical protein